MAGGITFAGLDIRRGAIEDILDSPDTARMLLTHGDRVRDRARDNATVISARLADAIWSEEGRDREGRFVDVGYNKSRPGWVLWFAEVGTINQSPQPHLRPALQG